MAEASENNPGNQAISSPDNPTVTRTKRPRYGRKVDYAQAAVMLAGRMTYKEIAQKFGVTAESLRVGMHRHGIQKTVLQTGALHAKQAESIAQTALTAVSERVRGKIAGKIESIADKLTKMPVTGRVRELKEQSEVLESLTRSSKPVFGWGEEPGISVLGAVALEPAVDIPARVVVTSEPASIPEHTSEPGEV